MDLNEIIGDWKKEASAARNTDREMQEQAFMNLAYGLVSQKAGKLMEDPHRLGFEIVYTNDDSSKMAGMFAFRIGRNMVSVPAIFINNDVKGTDLLYEHSKKLLRPLTPEWADYLISKYHHPEAMPQDPAQSNRMDSGMNLDKLLSVPLAKRGSADAEWDQFFDDLAAIDEHIFKGNDPILKEFMIDSGEDALTKLAAAMDSSFEFAEAMVEIPTDEWIVDYEKGVEKKASAPDIQIWLDPVDAPLTKMAAEDVSKTRDRGWAMIDNRQDLVPVIAKNEHMFQEVSQPGAHDMVGAGGELETLYIFKRPDGSDYDECCGTDPRADTRVSENLTILYHPGEKSLKRLGYHDKGRIFGSTVDPGGNAVRALLELEEIWVY